MTPAEKAAYDAGYAAGWKARADQEMAGRGPTAVRYEAIGIPAPKGSMRAIMRGGAPLLIHDNPGTASWQKTIEGSTFVAFRGRPRSGPLCVRSTLWMPRPRSVRREFPAVKPDLDKLLRALLDGMTGLAFEDDAQVVDAHVRKRYADGRDPGATITIEEVTRG